MPITLAGLFPSPSPISEDPALPALQQEVTV